MFLFNFIKLYDSTIIFNSLYEINISLVGIIHWVMHLIRQINLDLISKKKKKHWLCLILNNFF